ncbi:MAG: DNA replication/repair protein RecF [Cyanobacteriota bacterium]|nr:DNA replication/repair protein RecF [Cyanobacteriota bacterium]
MYLRSLHLRHFRNYGDQIITLPSPKTILLGDNAQGKTNLLEAVELLTTLKSRRCSRDHELVQTSHGHAQITATVDRLAVSHDLILDLRSTGRRSLRVNGYPVRRQVDFLGQVNAVMFSSLDLQLVRGGPEVRRDWLDDVLIQLEPVYVDLLETYRRILKQRNALLKTEREGGSLSSAEVTTWDHELAHAGTRLMRRRARLIERIHPLAHHWHQAISGGQEALTLRYKPQVPFSPLSQDPSAIQATFWAEMQAKRPAEIALGTSLVGPHRDDLEMQINQVAARSYGSQGQQRTLVLALKLAELELIEQVQGDPPLLLLDDVLAELDLHRQDHLLNAIQDRVQTLVTTTHLGSFDARWLQSAQILQVRQGQIYPAAAAFPHPLD